MEDGSLGIVLIFRLTLLHCGYMFCSREQLLVVSGPSESGHHDDSALVDLFWVPDTRFWGSQCPSRLVVMKVSLDSVLDLAWRVLDATRTAVGCISVIREVDVDGCTDQVDIPVDITLLRDLESPQCIKYEVA